MRRAILCACLSAPLACAANLAGTWKFTPPPNPQAPPNPNMARTSAMKKQCTANTCRVRSEIAASSLPQRSKARRGLARP
jgi:hypothetical protein